MAVTVLRAFDHGDGVISVVFNDSNYPQYPEVQISGFLPFRDVFQIPYDAWLGQGNAPTPMPTSMSTIARSAKDE